MNDPFIWFIAIIVLLVALSFGWIQAHSTVAAECERLGAFYVGKTVYECRPQDQKTPHKEARP
ncbi:MAG: hypothetical protein JSR53_14100 [Proteobacteria bacterium]|nr:hypothetical protein [Pseudomonadota bacterium]